jgi:hypothetical protein
LPKCDCGRISWPRVYLYHLSAVIGDGGGSEEGIARRNFKGVGTVLLVDDEKVIITFGQTMLETLGYEVLVARSGKEAVWNSTSMTRTVLIW